VKKYLATAAIALSMMTAAHAASEQSTGSTAEPVTLYTGTFWKTMFYASNVEGEPMCVTSGRWDFKTGAMSMMMLKWQPSLGLFVHITKSSWRFGPDIEVPLTITMDDNYRDGIGTTLKNSKGTSSMIQVNVNGTGEHFIRDFAAANSMVIKFKSGNEPAWTANMRGSAEASQALLKCIAVVKEHGNTSPVPNTQAPTSQAPTSPVPGTKTVPTTKHRDNGSI